MTFFGAPFFFPVVIHCKCRVYDVSIVGPRYSDPASLTRASSSHQRWGLGPECWIIWSFPSVGLYVGSDYMLKILIDSIWSWSKKLLVIGIVSSHGLAWAKWTAPVVVFHSKRQSLTSLLFSCFALCGLTKCMFHLKTGYDAFADDCETWKLDTRCLCHPARSQWVTAM